MARNIKVTPEELERTALLLEGCAEEYKGLYDSLYAETGNLASTWKGDDNVAFVNQIEGFKDDLKKMYDLINSYAEFLNISAKAYRDTQNAVVVEAKKLQN